MCNALAIACWVCRANSDRETRRPSKRHSRRQLFANAAMRDRISVALHDRSFSAVGFFLGARIAARIGRSHAHRVLNLCVSLPPNEGCSASGSGL
jgi:hypothetical protein